VGSSVNESSNLLFSIFVLWYDFDFDLTRHGLLLNLSLDADLKEN
jgi:hypothetical protein